MYRIKTIKEIESSGLDLRKIPKHVFENLGDAVETYWNKFILGQKDIDSMYVTSIPLSQPYSGIVRVINDAEWVQQNKHVKPSSDFKPWFGITLQHNAHLRCDCVGNFWYWDLPINRPNYISSQFIIRSDNMTTSNLNIVGNINLSDNVTNTTYRRAGDSMSVDASFISDSAKQKDLFKLETETEYKINLNQNSSYIAKRDVAGYKKGDILSYQKVDALTGDPLVIDLNTGKEIRIGYHDYEQRSNTEYLKMKQDN